MLSKNQLKLINSLRLSKFRLEHGLFIAEGVKLVDEALKSSFEIYQIFATAEWISFGHLPKNRYLVDVVEITQSELEKISALTTANQVLALVRIPSEKPVPDAAGEWTLLLDQIRDPGNLGTIIRTADWFGIDRIVAAENSVELWNQKVVQASMGSVFRMPVHYSDIHKYLSANAQHVQVYGTMLEGEDISKVNLGSEGIVIIGNESHGISDEVKPFISRRITIPAAAAGSSGRAESLNASLAGAIICYEIRRQCPK
ncbi:MAG: TrmH family RNA methyltransferase [Lentimicrobium sp.]